MNAFQKWASTPPESFIGKIPQTALDPKWHGSSTNTSEFNQPVKPYAESLTEKQHRESLIPNPYRADEAYKYTPKIGEIDNRAYAQQPYRNPLDFNAINAKRQQKGVLLPIQNGVSVAGNSGFGGPQVNNDNYSVAGTSNLALQDDPIYANNGEEHANRVYRDKEERMLQSGALVLPESIQAAAEPVVLKMGFKPGFNPSPRSAVSHEMNHINNFPTNKYREDSEWRQKRYPGFSANTYAHNPAEALQALASRKRAEAARGGKPISTPAEMENSLRELAQVDPNSPQNGPLLGEEQRLRNYLQQSARDYDRAAQDPASGLPRVRTPYKLGDPRGNPIFRNISHTYRDAIPDLVLHTPAQQNLEKVAAALDHLQVLHILAKKASQTLRPPSPTNTPNATLTHSTSADSPHVPEGISSLTKNAAVREKIISSPDLLHILAKKASLVRPSSLEKIGERLKDFAFGGRRENRSFMGKFAVVKTD